MAVKSDNSATQRFFATLDRAKGILIVLIVFAHNTLVTQSWPDLRGFFYNWHVFAFLLLALVMPFRSDKPGFLTTRFVRYYVPFIIFFTMTWAAMVVLGGTTAGLFDRFSEWAVAVLIGSAALLDQASGARLFWFLPALMGLVLIRWAIDQFHETVRPMMLGFVAIAGFLFAGLIPDAVKQWLPFGIPIALYVIGPGLVFAYLVTRALRADPGTATLALYAVLSAAVCGLLYAYSVSRGSALILASFDFYDIRSLDLLLAHAGLAMSAAAAVVFAAGAMGEARWLQWLGQASLLIYLVHQIIFVGLRAVAFQVDPELEGASRQAAGIATFVATMALSVAVAWLIQSREALNQLVAPRDWADWTRGLGKLLPFRA